MPKLWILSDLHLEITPFPAAYRPPLPDFDILVAAGDIWEGDTARSVAFIAGLAGGKPVVFVPGNHEHWHRHLPEDLERGRTAARAHGVTLLDGGEAEIGGIRFVGGTLWADGRMGGCGAEPDMPTGEPIIVPGEGGPRPMTVADSMRLHGETRRRLEHLLQRPRDGRPVVAVTHHAPHPLCIPDAMRDSRVVGLFASDLSHLTDHGLADLWVHGHFHHSIDMVRPGGTRILCNPAAVHFSNPRFDDALVVELG